MRIGVVIAMALSLVLLLPLLVADAYAKWPIHDADHSFGLALRMIILPGAFIGAAIIFIGLYVRQM